MSTIEVGVGKRKTTCRGALPPDKYLSDTQLKRLRQYVKDMADLARQRGSQRAIIDELIIELLANTGLRASELVALNIEDLPMSHGKPAVWVRNGKGQVMRTVDIFETLAKRLERFVRIYRKGAKSKAPLLAVYILCVYAQNDLLLPDFRLDLATQLGYSEFGRKE